MTKFDILTPIGITLGTILLSAAIIFAGGLTGAAGFISVSSILITIGGVVAALMVTYSMKDMKMALMVLKQTFYEKQAELPGLIETFVLLSTKARREGLLALEQEIENVPDPFIQKGILLSVDGIEPELIKEIMMAEVSAMEERHRRGRQIIEKAGEYAPAWGMIGTLIGLVLMLQTLNEPETLGPKMAVALITTFYGAVMANLVFLPMAGKLANRSDEEIFMKQLIIEGVLGVQSGQNPKILEEKLKAFLPPHSRKNGDEEGEEESNT
ncbi:flagellar motor protein MotP [Microaerobacter geothermalis]|uniref:flagellar motor protein MotP n=1 Tax=Microaerobacter geothermalis TaxID=674972 RepID=UPI001F16FA98|nr:flagellar motor protein MotP [Microaerobacter geothermalis]MCF6094898.1 flagellar motor protein MotP [Microaerobacter geothermalis]